ncbi:hypothetical protein V8G54_001636 [Vigna mungo]|uniref:Uncharacterized protein n=1 Tax=Vigna mungo TaxID=3915 RepID=A0AAQ3P9T5_VIGMU
MFTGASDHVVRMAGGSSLGGVYNLDLRVFHAVVTLMVEFQITTHGCRDDHSYIFLQSGQSRNAEGDLKAVLEQVSPAVRLEEKAGPSGFEIEIEGEVEVESNGGEEVDGGVEVDRDGGLEVETNGGKEVDDGVEVDKDGGLELHLHIVSAFLACAICRLVPMDVACVLGFLRFGLEISIQFLLNDGKTQRMVEILP